MNIAETKKRLNELIDRVNASNPIHKIEFHQQDVVKEHMSVTGGIGRLCVTPVSSGNDISLSGKEIEKTMVPFMEQLCGRSCDGYKQRSDNKGSIKQPYWRVKDFNLVEKAVIKYSSLDSSGFRNYLLSIGKTEKTAKNYLQAVDSSISQWAQEAGLINSSLINIQNLTELYAVINGIQQLEIFQERNSKGNGMYSAALKQFAQYLDGLTGQTIGDDIDQILTDDTITTTEKSTLINTRLGQGKFRENLINYWKGCAITHYPDSRFLVASHIKPWKDSGNDERLDAYNGLLLLPNIDKVFDLGYISFEESGKMLISEQLENYATLGIQLNMTVQLADQHQDYMTYHRAHQFKQ